MFAMKNMAHPNWILAYILEKVLHSLYFSKIFQKFSLQIFLKEILRRLKEIL